MHIMPMPAAAIANSRRLPVGIGQPPAGATFVFVRWHTWSSSPHMIDPRACAFGELVIFVMSGDFDLGVSVF
jgi:hypothetical protein